MTANLPAWRDGACDSRDESAHVPVNVPTRRGWLRPCVVVPASDDDTAHFGLVRRGCAVAADPERRLRVLLRYADYKIITRQRYWAWVHCDRNQNGTCHVDFDDGDTCRCTPAAATGAVRRMWRGLNGRRLLVGDVDAGRRHLTVVGFEADTGMVLFRVAGAAYACCPVNHVWDQWRVHD